MQAAFWISFLISVSITFPGSRAINMMTLQPLYMYIHIYIRTCILPGISLIREKRYMCCVTVYLVYKSMLIAVCEWIVVGQCQTISYNFVRKLREAWWYRNSAFYINDEKRWLCCNDNKLLYYRRHITLFGEKSFLSLSLPKETCSTCLSEKKITNVPQHETTKEDYSWDWKLAGNVARQR